MSSKTAPSRVRAAQRRSRAVALRLEGHTFDQIAADLQVTRQRAHQYVSEALAAERAASVKSAEELRQDMLARLNVLADCLWPGALAGDPASCKALLAVFERVSKLLGLDAPTRTEARVSSVAAMTEQELLAEA